VAAAEAAVEVEAVLRDRLDYGVSGRLIADFGETAVTLADAIAAELAAANLLAADPAATDTAAARAWDEGFEAAVEWVERCGRPADIGPPDPPLNPWDRTEVRQ
jgi:hypothetical protein